MRIKKQLADIVIVEGVRWKTDVPMLKSFPNLILVYITAEPKIRYERMRRRAEKEDEANKTYEQFLREEKARTEVDIPEIAKGAEVKIENNRTFDEFRGQIEKFAKEYLNR